MYVGLEFGDDVADSFVVLQVVLDDEAEQFCFWFLFEGCLADGDVDGRWVAWVEDGVDGFTGVGNEIVGVEVFDKVGEL